MLLSLGLAATAIFAIQPPRPAETRMPETTNSAGQKPDGVERTKRARTLETSTIRVVDLQGKALARVRIGVVEENSKPAGDELGYRTAFVRTGQDGHARVPVNPLFKQVMIGARLDDRAIGWVTLQVTGKSPKAIDEPPVTVKMLPINRQIEGTIVDPRGTPIRGVRVRVVQFRHPENGFATDSTGDDKEWSFGSTTTDDAGRYRLTAPQDTSVGLRAMHPRFVGPYFGCTRDGRMIAPVTLVDAGGIAGSIVDAGSGASVAGAQVAVQSIERNARVYIGGAGRAVSDTTGHFTIGGLAPGVYNVLLNSSPKGRQFTAKAVEGVRVKVGGDAQADLQLFPGRRLQGTVVDAVTGKPVAGTAIVCYNASHPRSGMAFQRAYTDEQGQFEYYVPPGPALVYIDGTRPGRARNISAGRDPDPIVLKVGYDLAAELAARPSPPDVACEVRLRVKDDAAELRGQAGNRTLIGRIFDERGAPLAAVQVSHINSKLPIVNNKPPNIVVTDRMGIFRLKDLPHEAVRLNLTYPDSGQNGWAQVPAEAVEIDLIWRSTVSLDSDELVP
jgi:hypothetical protein